jgi:hypothetical protein
MASHHGHYSKQCNHTQTQQPGLEEKRSLCYVPMHVLYAVHSSRNTSPKNPAVRAVSGIEEPIELPFESVHGT